MRAHLGRRCVHHSAMSVLQCTCLASFIYRRCLRAGSIPTPFRRILCIRSCSASICGIPLHKGVKRALLLWRTYHTKTSIHLRHWMFIRAYQFVFTATRSLGTEAYSLHCSSIAIVSITQCRMSLCLNITHFLKAYPKAVARLGYARSFMLWMHSLGIAWNQSDLLNALPRHLWAFQWL